ncbi:hypothetical protein TNIN_268581 [Trichonephila inaurata madagascariensis]|uniref:Uncharacterized protein n=1 Tax=Trichonephila inaurata madagascariensis TaxID=2747483 RepID=A0A8X6MGS6_9ARAC|nr:hypothetical protein TNIN_268581 [Trichonephila inaurata madagascariensis]
MRLIEDFNTLPSLRFISGSRIVINVWNRRDITHSIDECIRIKSLEGFNRAWEEIEDRVKAFIQRIEGVPRDLLKEMKAISPFIGVQISSIRLFAYFAPDSTYTELDFPITYWTAYGTVDIKRQEELLARSNMISTVLRYNLACNDCFEEIVEELFDLFSPVQKEVFQTFQNSELVSYWTHRQSNDLSTYENLISHDIHVMEHNYSAHQFAFLYSLLTRNKMGIEYFLNFLSRKNYELVVENHGHLIADQCHETVIHRAPIYARPDEHLEDAVYFLLSKLNEHERMQFLRKSPYKLLRLFLNYPFFGIFSTYVKLLIEDLEWQDISLLLNYIHTLEKLRTHFFGLSLFNDLWRICPQSAKTDIKTNNENHELYAESDFLSLLERIRLA